MLPIWLIGEATQYWQFLVLGLFVGLAGGSFSVGIAYCARWFDAGDQGFAMGIFGAGNSGAAVTKFVAPAIVVAFGWTMVPKVYAVAMLVTALAFWFFTYTDPGAPAVRAGSHDARRSSRAEGPERLEVLPVLLDRIRRLRRAVALDDQVLRQRIRLRPRTGAALLAAVLLAAGRRAARDRRLDVGQVGRAPVTWWVMLGPGVPVLPVLSADRHRPHDQGDPILGSTSGSSRR